MGAQFTVKQLALPALLHHLLVRQYGLRLENVSLKWSTNPTFLSDCMRLARLAANTKCHFIRVDKPRHRAFCTSHNQHQQSEIPFLMAAWWEGDRYRDLTTYHEKESPAKGQNKNMMIMMMREAVSKTELPARGQKSV